ncbi:Potassium transporter 11 [Citrus sinensis]|nr:Potassium transporter 11 [Citrus sinensis]
MAARVEIDEDNETNKGSMWVLDQKLDQPMDEEAGRLRNMYREKKFSSLLLLRFAFQSLGVVYGDLGTSPLYVFYNTFPHGIDDPEDIIGALSLIIYSLTLIPLLKYVFIVCRANDSGQGGTFALYSLLCRHAKVITIPNQHRTDEELTTYSRSTFHEKSFAAKTKRWLEHQTFRKNALLMLVLVGTCMVIGDGILTPAISVLSASGGIKVDHPHMSNGVVVLVAVVILVGLFSLQHYGTDRVGWLFAPIVLLWFLLIGGIGMLNIWKYDSSVLKAFSPVYIYRYFRRGGRDGWTSLGGIMLSITGTEALFADLAHFPVSAIQIAFTVVVFPCLLLAYSGQAAYLMNHQDHVVDAFYRSIPGAAQLVEGLGSGAWPYRGLRSDPSDSIYWPVFIVATAAAIVASQATISATFSIIKQALALGCFPRVKVVHTSKKFLGQIYIPDINWILMILCIAVTAGFKNQSQIGNAYGNHMIPPRSRSGSNLFNELKQFEESFIITDGTAVVIVMLATTLLMTLIMILVWRCHWILVLIFTALSLVVECTYFSAVLFKVDQGGWVPLVIAAAFLLIMYVWHYGTVKRYEFEMHSKVSMAWILGLGPSLGLVRVPGIGLVYTELASGVPHIFSHFITNLPAIHSVVVFVCVKYLPVYTVPEEERFLVKRIGPKNFHMFRCVARYGYKDLHKKDENFEKKLFDSLFLFVRLEAMMEGCSDSDEYSLYGQQTLQSTDGLLNNNGNSTSSNQDLTMSSVDSIVPVKSPLHVNSTVMSSSQMSSHTETDELEFLNSCRDAGVVHILGNTVVRASRGSKFYKKIAIDYIYAFLRKICRENSVIFNVPHESLLNVGQIFYV